MLLRTTGKSFKATQKQEFYIKKLFPNTASYTPVFLTGGCKNSLRLIHRYDYTVFNGTAVKNNQGQVILSLYIQ